MTNILFLSSRKTSQALGPTSMGHSCTRWLLLFSCNTVWRWTLILLSLQGAAVQEALHGPYWSPFIIHFDCRHNTIWLFPFPQVKVATEDGCEPWPTCWTVRYPCHADVTLHSVVYATFPCTPDVTTLPSATERLYARPSSNSTLCPQLNNDYLFPTGPVQTPSYYIRFADNSVYRATRRRPSRFGNIGVQSFVAHIPCCDPLYIWNHDAPFGNPLGQVTAVVYDPELA